ncbi:MAG: hypothetical protein LUM44_21520 [Pyrinomonadaceae bacterium]|nr:hypothetical protein [Pyrinomonadaceae bacterium]
MKVPLSLLFLMVLFVFNAQSQKRRAVPKPKTNVAQSVKPITNSAVVIDESLAVLRTHPSLFAESVQRMRRGRKIQVTGEKEADGVIFYRVNAQMPKISGWIQSEAVFGKFRRGDDERLARLIQASNGFDQLEIAEQFFEIYPDSILRPAILLLFGDLCEETAATLSKNATRRLNNREMAASGAPLHSYYLNFVSLDRYRKLGIVFFFNSSTKNYHYNGASWEELVKKYPNSNEAPEAQKRLDALKEKLEKK